MLQNTKPEKVVDELEWLREVHGVDIFAFTMTHLRLTSRERSKSAKRWRKEGSTFHGTAEHESTEFPQKFWLK